MTTASEKRAAALAQLNLVLSFFPRAESRLALVFSVDVSLLALMTAAIPPYARWDARMYLAGFAGGLFCVSLLHIWLGMFPNVTGGTLEEGRVSLVYFGTVGKRAEAVFVSEFLAQTDEAYTRDLLGQVWVNSRILTEKFDHLQKAFLWLLAGLVPWIAAVAMMAALNPSSTRLLP
jgi:hypothetical protein